MNMLPSALQSLIATYLSAKDVGAWEASGRALRAASGQVPCEVWRRRAREDFPSVLAALDGQADHEELRGRDFYRLAAMLWAIVDRGGGRRAALGKLRQMGARMGVDTTRVLAKLGVPNALHCLHHDLWYAAETGRYNGGL